MAIFVRLRTGAQTVIDGVEEHLREPLQVNFDGHAPTSGRPCLGFRSPLDGAREIDGEQGYEELM